VGAATKAAIGAAAGSSAVGASAFPDAWRWIIKPEDRRRFCGEVQAWPGRYLKGDPNGVAVSGTL